MTKRIIAQDETVVIGADVHMNKHVVTAKVGKERKGAVHLSPNPEAWRTFINRFPGCRIHVIYESGPQGYNLYDWLTQMNPDNGATISVCIAPPALVPKAPGIHVKTDKRDSMALILAIETNSFRPVVVPDKAAREERELTRTRAQIKDIQKKLKNQIHGLVKFHGVAYPQGCGPWSSAWMKQLEANVKATDTTGYLYQAFTLKRGLYETTTQTLSDIDKKIRQLTKTGLCACAAQKLQQLCGIGPLSAAIIATEVADFSAFDNSAAFASYIGVVPRESSSGETVKRGRITKAGNRRIRRILTECAWAWVRRDEDALRQFRKLCMGKPERARIAIVAMSRKLAVKAYHAVVNGPPVEKAA